MSMRSSRSAVTTARSGVLPLGQGHLGQALTLSQGLNWPYRAEDWAFAFDLGYGHAVEDDGALVGTALWWPHGDDFASAGMVIVAPTAQRQGIGARLMAALLDDAAGRTIILNSTAEGAALYTRLGFKSYGVVHQHQAILAEAPASDPAVSPRSFAPEDRPAVAAIDRAASGMVRNALLDAVLAVGEGLVVEDEDGVAGYACVRRWGRGVVIGPVVARTAATARALVATLAARHVGGFVRIDVTEASGLGQWLTGIGLPQVDRVVSMARGEPPRPSGTATLFALSNQSLG